MVLFVLGILLLAVALISLLVAIFVEEARIGGIAVTVIAGLIGGLMLVGSGMRTVPTKSIGVVTSYGRVQNTLGPGLHWMAPWKRVYIIDETIHTTTFEGTNQCLDVRIGGQQQGCLDVTIQWRVADAGASSLFYNYGANNGNFMNEVENAVVIRELKSVVNDVMGDYNPIQDVAANATSGNSQFSTFGPKVLALMRRDLAGRVLVNNLYMPFLHYDGTTQTRLNSIQQQYAATAIAKQQYQTNLAQAKANGAIKSSVSNDPGVLQFQCQQLVAEAIKANYQLPAGFNCNGSSTPVAVLAH